MASTQLKNNKAHEWLAVIDPREGEKGKSDVEGNDDNFRGEKTLSNCTGREGPEYRYSIAHASRFVLTQLWETACSIVL